MRRLFAVLLILTMLLSLTGCGDKPEPEGAPSPAATEAPVVYDTDQAMFAMTMECGRLYLLPVEGGEGVLLADKNTTGFHRLGNTLYAAFDDGSVMRCDLSTGETARVLEAGGPVLYRIACFDGGFVGQAYTMSETLTYIYREADGTMTRETRFGEYVIPYVAGHSLTCMEYTMEGNSFSVWDLNTLEVTWKEPVPDDSTMYCFDGVLYLYEQGKRLYRVDTEAKALAPLDLMLDETDFTLSYCTDGLAVVEGNYYNGNTSWIVTDSRRRPLQGSDLGYMSFVDAAEGRALFETWSYYQSDKVDAWYNTESFYSLDLASGELTKLEALGKYSPMFSAGDFPVMDSSTARKPVTAQIYSFFCESTGYGGAVPLCSTTHNAWLNIADGTADIALLAAPTQEEQDYLKEKNVTVEMKLYGGDGLVFIGNRACGVEDLTLDQARAIYRGEITNWAQLGGVDHSIRVLYRDDQSGSQRLFERLLWSGLEVPDLEALGFERLDEMSTIVSECLYDPYTIGYSIMTYLNDVYGKEDLLCFSLEGYTATPENVRQKLYPLSTRGYVVIRGDEPENSPARRLFDWFGSPLSDRILTDNGVTPLHDE